MDPTAILVPVLRRPWHVRRLLDNVAETTPEPYRLLFIADPDDQEELEELEGQDADFVLSVEPRNYAGKINQGYRASTEPVLFLGADDVRFHPGWLEAAQALLSDTVDVVGTNDLCNDRVAQGKLSTHTLVTRTYADRFGTIDEPGKVLHEGYPHEYVDDELIGTARKRGRYAHAHDSVVEHLHFRAGKSEYDSTYAKVSLLRAQSQEVYKQRRWLWR